MSICNAPCLNNRFAFTSIRKIALSTTDALLQRAIHRVTDYVCDKGRETRRLVVKRLIRALPVDPAAWLLNDIKILLRGYATINPIVE